MPKIKYRAYKPKAIAQGVIDVCNAILVEYVNQSMDLTLRQLHYQLVARDLYPDEWINEEYNRRLGLALDTKNTQKNYDRLGELIVNARESGMVDWSHIKDRGRQVSKFQHWRNAAHFVRSVMSQFSMDMWADQPKRVEVWVEKDALSQVMEMAADPFDVPTFATKGHGSASSLWEAGHNRFLQYAQKGQDIVILHLADHDPSGVHMTRDVQKRLNMFSTAYGELSDCDITVKRIALTMDQVEQYQPPSNPAKDSDSRKPAYVAEFGVETSWELDALDPPVLVQLITEHIEAELDQEKYDRRRQQEANHRATLRGVAQHWDQVQDFLDVECDEED